MRFSLKYKKSAGVPVTASVHRLIARGNGARQRHDWADAACAYRKALIADPGLAHIWVQLGHCEKEQGHTEQAEAAYTSACELRPSNPDPYIYLGHLASGAHNYSKACGLYFRAFQIDPSRIETVSDLHLTLSYAEGHVREQLIAFLTQALGDPPGSLREDRSSQCGSTEDMTMAFDVSDLVGYFAHSRLPTGIQRVQIMAISNALTRPNQRVVLCCFIDGRNDWLEIPVAIFRRLIELSSTGAERSDPDWINALQHLHLRLIVAPAFAFPDGAYLVNLGSSSQLHNYFLLIREAKARHRIRYIPFVHDLIPIVAPQHFTKQHVRDFVAWFVGVVSHADYLLVNSQATRQDLIQAAAILGRRLDERDVAAIPLDADCRTPGLERLPDSGLSAWGLEPENFVLLVSTIEPRKGHEVAFDAWLELIERHGADRVPKLVCVGRNGWMNDSIYQRLESDSILAGRVSILSGVSDGELALLYRHCLFTIYPSQYEGWGLPVTEALCYGKPVIAAESSSLPEAGGIFATYVEPGSASRMASAVDRMIFDTDYRNAIVARIAAGFRPRSWAQVAQQIEAELARLPNHGGVRTPALAPAIPVARLGAFHPIARGTMPRLRPGLGSGEMFRTGIGWHTPVPEGCWTRPGGGELSIGLPADRGALRVSILLLGAPRQEIQWRLRVEQGPTLQGTLHAGGQKWVAFDYTADSDGDVLRLHMSAGQGEAGGRETDPPAIGVAGFHLRAGDDHDAAIRLLEAIVMGDLESIEVESWGAQTA